MYCERSLSRVLEEATRFFKVVLISGPRQVGKTTLFGHMAEDGRRTVTLDDSNALMIAKEDPELFFQTYAPPVLVDEVQRIPELFRHIKRIVDLSDATGQMWITGSQVFELMRGVSDSLAGRVAVLRLQGLSLAEKLGDPNRGAFLPDLKPGTVRPSLSRKRIFEEMFKGSYPQLLNGTPPDLFYPSYVTTYIERDVRDIINLTRISGFMRFLKAVAARTGQELNYNDLSRDVEVSVATVKNWISVLETSGIIYLLPAFSGNLLQRAIRTPKLYFMDTGLCCYLCGIDSAETLERSPVAGAMFETLVVSEILKSYWHSGKIPYVYFYRDYVTQKEIDLIIEERGKLWPVEIKLSSAPNLKMARHFEVIPEERRGQGAVISTAEAFVPLSPSVQSIPVSYI